MTTTEDERQHDSGRIGALLAELERKSIAHDGEDSTWCRFCDQHSADPHAAGCIIARLVEEVRTMQHLHEDTEARLQERVRRAVAVSLFGDVHYDHVRVAVRADHGGDHVNGHLRVLSPYNPDDPEGDGATDEQVLAVSVQVPLDDEHHREQLHRITDKAGEELGRRMFGKLLASRIAQCTAAGRAAKQVQTGES